MKALKRKTRSDKFPLTLHPTGQYCKKVKGKIYYFGSDKKSGTTKIFGSGSISTRIPNYFGKSNER